MSKHSYCPKNCPYLLKQFNACASPEFANKGKLLTKNNSNFIQICTSAPQNSTQKTPKTNKFNAKKVTVGDITYDSKLEYERHCELAMLEVAGKIAELKRQVEYVLIPKSEYGREIKYVADFQYIENGKLIVEDVKSNPTKTRLYALKKRLMAEKYGIKIREFFRD